MTKTQQPFDKTAAKLAYYGCQEHAARLATVATSNHAREFRSSLLGVVEEHARNDLVMLSLAMRRLAEQTNLKVELASQTISEVRPFVKGDQVGFYSTRQVKHTCWDLLGKIIHHRQLEFFQDEIRLKILLGNISRDAWEIYNAKRTSISFKSAFFVRSDYPKPAFVLACDIVHCAVSFLDKAEYVLADEGLYVGSLAAD